MYRQILMRSHNSSTATDLNLHRLPPKKPSTEQQELEMLNHVRTWINCFNLDKSMATQFGKPSTLKEDTCALSCCRCFCLARLLIVGYQHRAQLPWVVQVLQLQSSCESSARLTPFGC